MVGKIILFLGKLLLSPFPSFLSLFLIFLNIPHKGWDGWGMDCKPSIVGKTILPLGKPRFACLFPGERSVGLSFFLIMVGESSVPIRNGGEDNIYPGETKK